MKDTLRCRICGRTDAHIRETEIGMARITGKAHVDCGGHSQYRHVGKDELPDADTCETCIYLPTGDLCCPVWGRVVKRTDPACVDHMPRPKVDAPLVHVDVRKPHVKAREDAMWKEERKGI